MLYSRLLRCLLLYGFNTIGNTADGNKFACIILNFHIPDMFKISFYPEDKAGALQHSFPAPGTGADCSPTEP
jgi:hypothetical protein